MNKIKAVIKREYLSIVKTKSFIIMTLLMPLITLLFLSVPFLMSMLKSGTTNVAILDESGLFFRKIESNSSIRFEFVQGGLEELKESFKHNFDALVHIPNFDLQYPGGIKLFGEKQIGIQNIAFLESQIEKIIEVARFERAGIDKELVERLKVRIRIESIVISDKGEKAGNTVISFAIGYIMGIIMYFIIFIYGSMIMKTVVDEKKNRIVEILVSSIRPFELMLGKIFGIAAVAVTQLLIWIVLGGIIFAFFSVGIVPYMEHKQAQVEIPAEMQNNMAISMIEFMNDPGAINVPSILISLVFYFIFGYLFYSTLFAAVGSLSDDDTQSQTFTLPITIPIILSLFIMLNVVQEPHSALAFWASIVPFSSPIVMLARMPFNVPAWQLVLSGAVLILSFFGTAWVAGKIYRTAILLYGKKLTWKDLWKFLRV